MGNANCTCLEFRTANQWIWPAMLDRYFPTRIVASMFVARKVAHHSSFEHHSAASCSCSYSPWSTLSSRSATLAFSGDNSLEPKGDRSWCSCWSLAWSICVESQRWCAPKSNILPLEPLNWSSLLVWWRKIVSTWCKSWSNRRPWNGAAWHCPEGSEPKWCCSETKSNDCDTLASKYNDNWCHCKGTRH